MISDERISIELTEGPRASSLCTTSPKSVFEGAERGLHCDEPQEPYNCWEVSSRSPSPSWKPLIDIRKNPPTNIANLGRLPFDILFQILDHVDTKTLKKLLPLTKALNLAANVLLWKHVDAGSSHKDRALKNHLQRYPKFLRLIRFYVSYNVSTFMWVLPRLSQVIEVRLRWDFSRELRNPFPRAMNILKSSDATNSIVELDVNVYISHDEFILRQIPLFTALRILRVRVLESRPNRLKADVPQARCQLTAKKLLSLIKSPTLEHLIIDGVDRRLPPISRQNLPNLRSMDMQLDCWYGELIRHLITDLQKQNLRFRFRAPENTYEFLIASIIGRGYPFTFVHAGPLLEEERTALLTSFFDSMLYMNSTFDQHDHIAISRTSPVYAELERIRNWIDHISEYPTTFSVHIATNYQYRITPKSPTHFIFQIPEYHADSALPYFISKMPTLRRVCVSLRDSNYSYNHQLSGKWTWRLPKNRKGSESWEFNRATFRVMQSIDSIVQPFSAQRISWFEECPSLERVRMTVHSIDLSEDT
jgi:hypothetical protein